MIDFSMLLLVLGTMALCLGLLLKRQHRLRAGEHFIPLEAEALTDISHAALGNGQQAQLGVGVDSEGPLRFRYYWQGQERIGQQGNPWGLPAIPQLLPGGRLRIYFHENRDQAYIDVRTTLIPGHIPLRLGWALIALALLIWWLG